MSPQPDGGAGNRPWVARVRAGWHAVERFYDEWFESKWRHAVRREAQTQSDTFRALLFLQSLGVDDPASYETLDVIPYLVADLHAWHQRMGREEFGAPGGCC